MDRYQRVERPKAETPIDEKEIRISNQGSMRNYISYALTLLQENGSNQIVFKAMGKAINRLRRPMSRGNVEYEDGGGNHNRGYGRGRGRGSRGHGRGGYNGQQADRMEDGGYNYEVPI
ncbi:hypothetical protein Gotur_002548, partial [Gossypium turneri]